MTGARSDHPSPREHLSAELSSEGTAAPLAANVVPFRRSTPNASSKHEAPAIVVLPADRPAPLVGRTRSGTRSLAVLIASVMLHAALYAAANREPEPMASIGLEAISVEIVLGDDREAGTPAPPSEVDTALAEPRQQTEAKPEEPLLERPMPAMPATSEEKPAMPAAPAAAAPLPEPDTTAAIAPPVARAENTEIAAPREETPAREPAPAPPEPIVAAPRSVEAVSRQTEAAAPKPAPRERRAARAEPGAANPGSNGVSPGRSSVNSNYHGLIAAHLARHKRFPIEARSRGEEGRPVVSFVLDGGGRVTRVNLSRASGVTSIDQEAQAMVRRASPFPAPPDGRPASFTVPVSFRIQ